MQKRRCEILTLCASRLSGEGGCSGCSLRFRLSGVFVVVVVVAAAAAVHVFLICHSLIDVAVPSSFLIAVFLLLRGRLGAVGWCGRSA